MADHKLRVIEGTKGQTVAEPEEDSYFRPRTGNIIPVRTAVELVRKGEAEFYIEPDRKREKDVFRLFLRSKDGTECDVVQAKLNAAKTFTTFDAIIYFMIAVQPERESVTLPILDDHRKAANGKAIKF